jgi:hypothetical protein
MQQINLYLPEFRPNREPLRAMHMPWGLLAVFILLLAVSVYRNQQHTQLLIQLTQAQQTQQTLQTQLQNVTAQIAAPNSVDLDKKIQQLQKDLQRRQQILAIISSKDLGNDKGFSAQLTALAEAALNTLSIETFSLQQGGTYAELSGKARSADQIPLYLQKLRASESFANVGFGVLNIIRDEKNNGLLQFSLAKTTLSAEKLKQAEQDEKTKNVVYQFLTQPTNTSEKTLFGGRR